MNDLRLFEYRQKPVRTVDINGEIWFVAKDACSILELGNVSLAVNGRPDRPDSGLDDDERGIANVNTPSGMQDMLVISEPGLFRLILSSRKPEAKYFKRWVVHEVLPSIRNTGRYDPVSDGQLPVVLHASHEVQIAMSKLVNGFNYHRFGKTRMINYCVASCRAVTGKTPKKIMAEAKEAKMRSKDRSSSRAVLRVNMPAKACCVSFGDNLVIAGIPENEVLKITPNAESLFNDVLRLGATPHELVSTLEIKS